MQIPHSLLSDIPAATDSLSFLFFFPPLAPSKKLPNQQLPLG